MDPARLRAALALIHRLAFTSFVASVTYLSVMAPYARFDAEYGDHNDRGNVVHLYLAPMLALGVIQGYRAMRLHHRLGRETRLGRRRRVVIGAMLAPLALTPIVMIALGPMHLALDLALTAMLIALTWKGDFPSLSPIADMPRFERILGVPPRPLPPPLPPALLPRLRTPTDAPHDEGFGKG